MQQIERTQFNEVVGGGTPCGEAVGSAIGNGISAAASIGVAAASPSPASVTAAVDAVASTVSSASSVASACPAPSNQDVTQSCNMSGNAPGCDGGDGGGGKVICTELCRNGAIEHDVWMADIRYSRENFSEQTMHGYHLWGIPYVKLMRKYPCLPSWPTVPRVGLPKILPTAWAC